MLIFFRVLQGAGGGGLQPSEQAILADTFPPKQRGMAFAVYGMAVVLAPAIGPTLGGWITDNFDWRWIFFINIPVGILSLLLTNRLIHDPPYLKQQKQRPFRVDYIGLGLLAVGLGLLQVVLDKGERDDWFGSHFILIVHDRRDRGADCAGHLGMVSRGSDHRSASLPRTLVCHRQFADVHGGLRADVEHGAAAALHADDLWATRRSRRGSR